MAIPKSNLEAAVRRLDALEAGAPGQERTTSLSKSSEPAFERAPNLGQAFEEAKAAEQPIEKRPAPPAPEISEGYKSFPNAPDLKEAYTAANDSKQPIERSSPVEQDVSQLKTAFESANNAKQPLEHRPLEKAPDVGRDFANAANDNNQQDKSQGQGGSEMVRNDRPHPYPKPELPGTSSVDREAFDRKWEAEHARADKAQEQIKAAAERQDSLESDYSQQRDRSNGMEM